MSTDTLLNTQIDEIVKLVGDLMRQRRSLPTVLPEDLAQLRERLADSHFESGSKRSGDYNLLYRTGVVLTEHDEPLTMGELSRLLDVPLSTATRIVDWLVEGGFVERLPDLDDRRIVRVGLTSQGRQLYQTLYGFLRERIEQVLSRFDAGERDQMVALLRKLVLVLGDLGK